VVDCAHPAPLARFWATVLQWPPPTWTDEEMAELANRGVTDSEQDPTVFIESGNPALPRICFQQVPEERRGQNRLHLDVNIDSAADVDILLGQGAQVLQRFESWVVLADPEGNEFCATWQGWLPEAWAYRSST
jgi:hypothetical protein